MVKKVVDAKGLAEHFGKSIQTIYRWSNVPGFPCVKRPGMPKMYHVEEVENWFRSSAA